MILRRLPTAVVTTLLLSLVALSADARAAGTPHVVDVTVHGRADPSDCLEPAVAGALKGAGFEVRWRDGEPPMTAAARLSVDVDLRSRDRARLAFVSAGASAAPSAARDVRLDHGLDEAGCEEIAQVVKAAVVSLVDVAPEPPATRVPAPPASGAPAPSTAAAVVEAPSPLEATSAIEAAYALGILSWPLVAQRVEVGFMRHLPWAFERSKQVVRIGYTFPATADSNLVSVRFQTLSLCAGGLLTFGGPPRWIEWEAYFGFALTRIEPHAVDGSAVVAAPAQWNPEGYFGHRVGLLWRVGAGNVLALSVVLDVHLPQRWEVSSGANQAPVVVFDAWMFRPGLQIGLRW